MGGPTGDWRWQDDNLGRYGELRRIDRLRVHAADGVWLITLTVINVSIVSLGNLVTSQWTHVRADVTWPLRWMVKLYSFSGELFSQAMPRTTLALIALFVAASAAQLAWSTATSFLPRAEATALVEHRGITLLEAFDIVGRPSVRKRFTKALSLSYLILKLNVLACVIGAVVGLIGWLLALFANHSTNSVANVVVAVVAMPVLFYAGSLVGDIRPRSLGSDDQDKERGHAKPPT